MNFRNLKIGNRLTIAFSVIILFNIGIGLFGIWQIDNVADQTEKFYNHPFQVNAAVLRCEGNILKMQQSMKDIVFIEEISNIDAKIREIDDLEKLVLEDFVILRDRFLGDKTFVSRAETLFLEWRSIRLTTIDLIRNDDREGAAENIKNTATPQLEKIYSNLKEVKVYSANRAKLLFKNAQEISSSAAWMMLILSLILAIIGFIFSYNIKNSIVTPMKKVVDVVNKISDGDLKVKIDVDSQDEAGLLSASMQKMIENLVTMISRINETADMLWQSSQEMASNSQQVSQSANEQASSTEEVSSSMEEMTANIQQNSDNALQTEKIALKAAQDISDGSKQVATTIQSMKIIADKISIISEIAFQTNILALNAAVEAARAGEHGKGFAVVASEVRKLAERSQKAAAEINQVSRNSVNVAEKSGKLLDEIVPDIQSTARLVQEIASASAEQNSGISQINNAIQQLNEATQRNAAASEEMTTSAEELANLAEQLKEAVAFFKVEQENKHLSVQKTQKTHSNFRKTPKNKGFHLDLGKKEISDGDFERF